MKQVKYVGHLGSLKGCAALAQACDKAGTTMVQFTDVNERTVNELKGKKDVSDMEQLMFGWHEMPSEDFEQVVKAKKRTGLAKTRGAFRENEDG